MHRRLRLTGTLTAAALTAASLTPQAANAAAEPKVLVGKAKPALAPAVIHHAVPATTGGVTAALTATNEKADGLTIALDATASSTINTGADITNYAFSYGDGQSTPTNTTGTATHLYAQPGTYTVSVTVTDSTGATAITSTTLTTTGADYTPLTLDRILDTRSGLGAPEAKLTYGSSITLQVTGTDGIPTGATGVVLNLTATNTTDSGVINCYPDSTSDPAVSNLDYNTGQTTNNLVTIPIGTDGKIDCSLTGQTATSTDLIGDLEGYYSPVQASPYIAIKPGRILDSRSGSGIGTFTGQLTFGKTISIPIEGSTATTYTSTTAGDSTETLPSSNITAVAVNITVTGTTGTGSGIITADAYGTTGDSGNNINYATDGATDADAAIVKVGTDGDIQLTGGGASSAAAYVIVDVTGYYYASGATAPAGTSPAVYVPTTETQIADTGNDVGYELQPGGYYLAGALTTANGATAYILNTTVTSTTGNGNIAVHPDAEDDNITSNINYSTGDTIPALTQATASGTGIDFLNNSTDSDAQLVIDEFGYFTTQ